jgi:hypothetical protein
MDLKTEYEFDADPDAVYAMLTDPEFVRRKSEDAGHTEISVDIDGGRIVCRRNVAVDVPGALKKLLSPTNTVTQTDEWEAPVDGVRHGTWKVEIKGVPISLSGAMELAAADGGGSVETITGRIKASVPLLGGKLEKLGYSNFVEQTAQEQDFSNRWIAGKV